MLTGMFGRRRWAAISALVMAASVCIAAAYSSRAHAQEGGKTENLAAVRAFNAAAGWQNLGNFERAAAKWKEFLDAFPDDERAPTAGYHYGYCLLRDGKRAEAAEALADVVTRYPDLDLADSAQYYRGMALYEIALDAKRAEDFRAAAAALGDVAKNFPDSRHNHKALYYAGDALYSARDAAAAIDAFRKLIEKFPAGPLLSRAYYDMGTAQQERKDHEAAVKTFGQFLANETFAKEPLALEVRLRQGISLFELKRFAEAARPFEAVRQVKDFPQADLAMFRQGQCLVELDQTADAAALFAALPKQFSKSPYAAPAQLAAGRCYYQSGKHDDARKQLEPLAGGKDEIAAEAAYWLGQTLLAMKKPEDAVKTLERAVSTHAEGPFVPYLRMSRIDALYEIENRRSETKSLYEKFVGDFPDHALTPQARYMAALVSLANGELADARKHAEAFLANRAYQKNELVPEVTYIAAEAYLLAAADEPQGGGFSKAEELYRKLTENHPGHDRAPRARLRVGWCLYQQEEYDKAVDYLQDAVKSLDEADRLAEAYQLIGRNHAAAGEHEKATGAYEKSRKASPKWDRGDETLLLFSQSLQAMDQRGEAAGKLAELIASYPNSEYGGQALYLAGEMAQVAKDYDTAVSRYRELVEKHGDGEFATPARYGLGAVYFTQKEYAKAVEALDQLLAGKPQPEMAARGHYVRGLAYQAMEKFEPAIGDFKAFLSVMPNDADAFTAEYTIALCQVGMGKPDDAAATLEKLRSDKPDHPDADKALYELGHIYHRQNRAEDSLRLFRTLAEKHPDSPSAAEAWFHVGSHHEAQARSATSEDARKTAAAAAAAAYAAGLAKVDDGPLHEKLQYKLGDMRFRQEQYGEAAEALLEQVDKHPDGELAGPGRFLAALSLYRKNEYERALPLFAQVARDKAPDYTDEALYHAGASAAAIDKWRDSERCYDALIQNFPEFDRIEDARYGLGRALQMQDKQEEAVKVFQAVAKGDGEPAAKARFMLGEIAFGQDRYEDAIDHFLLAGGYPYKQWQVESQFEIGRCLMEMKQNDKAIAAFERLIGAHGDHPKAKQAEQLIEVLKKG